MIQMSIFLFRTGLLKITLRAQSGGSGRAVGGVAASGPCFAQVRAIIWGGVDICKTEDCAA